ncbi:hypothetical protein Tco_0008935 [Tanacetum coccineum]
MLRHDSSVDSIAQEFDIEIRDKKGAENLAADHLSKYSIGFAELRKLPCVEIHLGADHVIRRVFLAKNFKTFSSLSQRTYLWETLWCQLHSKKNLRSGFYGPPSTRMPMTLSPVVTFVNVKEKLRNVMRCHKTPSKFAKSLTSGALILWGRFRLQEETSTYSWLLTICQNGSKQKRSPPMMPELSANF